jgi:hypothetical protein
MTVPVPYSLPVSSSWQLVDWADKTYTGTADAAGVALITLDQLPDFERWQLTHMVAGAATTAAPSMRLYLDTVSNGCLRDGTSAGAFDVADWPAGLMVPARPPTGPRSTSTPPASCWASAGSSPATGTPPSSGPSSAPSAAGSASTAACSTPARRSP